MFTKRSILDCALEGTVMGTVLSPIKISPTKCYLEDRDL